MREKALNSGKAIAYVPSDDGNVYEIRKNGNPGYSEPKPTK